MTEEARAALESALRYFRADEEEPLFPRLRQMRNPNVESAIERLEPLEDEHRLAGPLHAEVEELGQERLATGNLNQRRESLRRAGRLHVI